MKAPHLIFLLLLSFQSAISGQIAVPNPFKNGKKISLSGIKTANKTADDLLGKFDRKNPVSTTFDDAVYEAEVLSDFDPDENECRPLYLQPVAETGGYRLKSGLYSMTAKSFCLRGYTHGPSKGDGHLYAPLKGKKAGFVQSILEHYGKKPKIPQPDVQVLLWAIIAGANMDALGAHYAATLNELFTPEELLIYKGKDWLNGIADNEIDEYRQSALNKVSPQLQQIINADNQIRTMVAQNKAFQEIEKVAIIAGVAPAEDMIREVTRGRWSYHSDGYFVRFFPNGYPQTRIDVFVPLEGSLEFDGNGKVTAINDSGTGEKEIIFNPAKMVAMPANRSSQRIGQSSVPVSPCMPPENYKDINFQVSGVPVIAQSNESTCWAAVATMMYLWKTGKKTGSEKDIAETLEKHSWNMTKYYQVFGWPATPSMFDPFYTEDMHLTSYTKCPTRWYQFWKARKLPPGWSINNLTCKQCIKPVPTILELQELLCKYGPLAWTYKVKGGHVVIINGIKGDKSGFGAILSITDPWGFDGKQTYEMPYDEFINRILGTLNVDCDYYNIYHW